MAKAYRGVLKARINKIYGGDVTVDKARKLKARKGATSRDKQLANWFINMQTNRPSPNKRKDPLVGTGKKPKGSGRRLYTDENPKDTVSIKFATPSDARSTVAKVKRINKPYARKIQILTVGEQRAKVMGKAEVASIFKKGKQALKNSRPAKYLDTPVNFKKPDVRRTIGPGKNFNKARKTGTGAAAGGGMTQKGVDEYRRKNPGSKLRTAVTTKPSKLKPGSKAAKRRKSFCARSRSWTSERGRAARRRWNC